MGKQAIPRGLRNNNPGNIRANNDLFQGEVRPSRDKDFKEFDTPAYGYRAMFVMLRNYKKNRGCDTIRKMINRWAPPVENHTDNYVMAVAAAAGISPDAEVDTRDGELMMKIVAGMSRVENGRDADMNDVKAGWDLL
jgi:hypothetical protein